MYETTLSMYFKLLKAFLSKTLKYCLLYRLILNKSLKTISNKQLLHVEIPLHPPLEVLSM